MKWFKFLLLALLANGILEARERVYGFCENGAVTVVTNTTTSTTQVQGSYPGCTITIYLNGTLTPAMIFSDNSGTVASNPLIANDVGYWFYYADNGRYDIRISGAGIPSPFVLGDVESLDPLEPTAFKNANQVRYASQFPGSDCGAKINAAYVDLPPDGGKIVIEASCIFATPIFFNTPGKMGLLEGFPGASVNLTFTGLSGTAITLDYGNQTSSGTILTMGKGLRDITLTGPGSATGTVGIRIGLTNGAQGTALENFEIQSFGTNVQFGNQTWIVNLSHGMIRNGNINVLFPNGTTNSGENIQWDHVTFADGPTLTTGQVQLLSGEHKLINCSFDNAQLVIGGGSGGGNNGLVTLVSPHFENPNFSTITGWYDFVVVSANIANHVSIISPFFNQDSFAVGTQPEYISIAGGQLFLTGVELFTPVGPVTQFVNATNTANVYILEFNDLSGQVTRLVGGGSTGYLVQIPGTNTNSLSGFNNVIGPGAGTNSGGGLFDITGLIRSAYNVSVPGSGVLAAVAPTGIIPLVINSTTPVPNLSSGPTTYTNAGTQVLNTHFVFGQLQAVSGTATLTLTGLAGFSNSASYQCTSNDISTNNFPVNVIQDSGTQIRFIVSSLHPTDTVGYTCHGN